ncbi:MAG: DNA mismatch repair protein MutT [Tistrella sp.]|uniref:DNA mismatch repair protein MutT n=1 Tax=Tistrella mobilis TaxID=171437 RepID=A0A3B9IEU2_9PROT|nr:DNA mismatch repair protein MutT [Tistrella sp.]HAE46315.1 DNA mismatch repair protein MutT [Tistrella mobilis]
MTAHRRRPAARLFVVDGDGRILLFRFTFLSGPTAGQGCWATPGGGVEPGESFEQAAVRELYEEVGLVVDHPGPAVFEHEVELRMSDGEIVLAEERFFLIRLSGRHTLVRDNWTELERRVLADHRWWHPAELIHADAPVYPADIPGLLRAAGLTL